MQVQFTAIQTVEMAVPDQPIPIQHYLRQPQRLIKALVDQSRTEQLSSEVFRLKMRPLSFIMLSVQPTVDIRVWAEANGTIHLESIACQIRGVEYIDQRFNLKLIGQLAPSEAGGKTRLSGQANLEVQVDIPPALWFTPRPLLEATGNGLLRSVLATIKQRLMYQLLEDYRVWAIAQMQEPVESPVSLLSSNSPLI
jgi:Protein of unknown function (DUF1997)